MHRVKAKFVSESQSGPLVRSWERSQEMKSIGIETLDDYISDLVDVSFHRTDDEYGMRNMQKILWNSKRVIKPFFLKGISPKEAYDEIVELLEDKIRSAWR